MSPKTLEFLLAYIDAKFDEHVQDPRDKSIIRSTKVALIKEQLTRAANNEHSANIWRGHTGDR